MRRNYRTKLGLGYDEAKFNYLNNSQFSCFYIIILLNKNKKIGYRTYENNIIYKTGGVVYLSEFLSLTRSSSHSKIKSKALNSRTKHGSAEWQSIIRQPI
jgi:hypothetical protein